MNLVPGLRAAEDELEDELALDPPASPTVFVRTLSTPAGAPWDQARAAALEARVGAPLPLGEVVYQLKRLDRWSFGQPGRYAACYVRAKEIGEDFQTVAEIDGRAIEVRFLSLAERGRRSRRLATVAVGVALTCLMVFAAALSALSNRTDLDDRLAALEQGMAVRLRAATAQQRVQEQTRALMAAQVSGHTVSDVLNDLAWASANKVGSTHIDALHWESGFMGVEVRGDGAPFVSGGRSVTKVNKELRPDVWLWGVSSLAAAKPAVIDRGAP